jgi:hypothetical protein
MLEDKGNTAAYLMYQYTRIKSICRTAGVDEKDVMAEVAKGPLVLEHEKEINLSKVSPLNAEKSRQKILVTIAHVKSNPSMLLRRSIFSLSN